MPLDIERHSELEAYLRRSGRIGAHVRVEARTLAGGVSNRTVLVSLSDGHSWVLKQALAQLRVAVEWFSDPARIRREALGLRYLAELCPKGAITPLVFEDQAENLLAMEAVPQPHENWKTILLAGRVEADHVRQFAELLACIHRSPSLRRAELAGVFEDRSFFESLRLEPYYEYAAARVPAAGAFLKELVERTRSRRLALVHGDYSPKNVLVHEGTLVLLDHEVIHFGDPAFDLGFGLTHLISKAHHLKAHRAAFADAARAFFAIYLASVGDVPWRGDLEAMAVRQTLGCLLARVAGRSPLEYLSPGERAAQQRAVLELLPKPPAAVSGLVTEFLQRV